MLRCPGFRRFPNVLAVAMACGSARFIHAAFSVGTSNADQQGTGSTGHSYGATRSVMSRFQFHTMGVLWGFQNASMQQKTTCFRGAGNAAAMYKFQQASIFVDTSRKTRGVLLEVLDASCRFSLTNCFHLSSVLWKFPFLQETSGVPSSAHYR